MTLADFTLRLGMATDADSGGEPRSVEHWFSEATTMDALGDIIAGLCDAYPLAAYDLGRALLRTAYNACLRATPVFHARYRRDPRPAIVLAVVLRILDRQTVPVVEMWQAIDAAQSMVDAGRTVPERKPTMARDAASAIQATLSAARRPLALIAAASAALRFARAATPRKREAAEVETIRADLATMTLAALVAAYPNGGSHAP